MNEQELSRNADIKKQMKELLDRWGDLHDQLRSDSCVKEFHADVDNGEIGKCPMCHYAGTIEVSEGNE